MDVICEVRGKERRKEGSDEQSIAALDLLILTLTLNVFVNMESSKVFMEAKEKI